MSETLNIECRTPLSLKNNKEEYEYLKKLEADLAIVVGYGQILSKEILGLTKKGFINIHASLLPYWRGAAPIQRSLMNSEKKTGISFMKITEELDAGPICDSYTLDILENEQKYVSCVAKAREARFCLPCRMFCSLSNHKGKSHLAMSLKMLSFMVRGKWRAQRAISLLP